MKKYFALLLLLLSGVACAQMTIATQQMPTRELLQYLAQFSGKNVIVGNSITGRVSLQLASVSWEEALRVVLKSQGLIAESDGPVIYIESLLAQAKQKEQQEQMEAKTNAVTHLVQLHYAKVNAVKSLLKPSLQAGTELGVDQSENILLVKASPKNWRRLSKLILKIDRPVPEVKISAKIVNVDSHYANELGARFGLTSGHHLTGTLKGASQLAAGKSAAELPFSERLLTDMPVIAPGAAHLGVALFKVAGDTLLDAELSALEAEGKAKLISSPELIAANQQSAMIQSGQEIPYQEKTGEGDTSVTFKKAVLSLEVRPQVLPNNKVILHLTVTQDKPGSTQVLGVPTIDTHKIETNVLLQNKQTVVLGGIYEQMKTNSQQRVPIISRFPIIGALFRYRKTETSKRELMIFVTPTILKE